MIITQGQTDEGLVSIRLLHEFAKGDVHPDKLRDLWLEFCKHDVLFGDQTHGKFSVFFDSFRDPRSIWFELIREEDGKILGVMMAHRVILGYDAVGHFAIWNGRARGKEILFRNAMDWVFDRYKLHRMTVQAPAYQSGVIRFVKRLGFKKEGIMREGVLKDGTWVDLDIFGITITELEEIRNG